MLTADATCRCYLPMLPADATCRCCVFRQVENLPPQCKMPVGCQSERDHPHILTKEATMSWTRILGAGILFFGIVLVGAAGTDTAKRLVGVWEVTKSEEAPPGAIVEFTKDGKIRFRAKIDDKELKVDGTYELKKDQIV